MQWASLNEAILFGQEKLWKVFEIRVSYH